MEKNSVTPRARSRGSGWPVPARPLPAAPRAQYYTGDSQMTCWVYYTKIVVEITEIFSAGRLLFLRI